MLIYRIEHPETKCGPYNTGCIEDVNSDEYAFIDEMIDEHSEDQKFHPVMGYDFKPEQIKGDVLCACPTLDSLYEWFAGWLDQLLELGFKVYEIGVSEATLSKSKKQLVFFEENITSMKIIH